MIRREQATIAPDLPHGFEVDPDAEQFCVVCGLVQTDPLHAVQAYRQSADLGRLARELGS